MVSTCVEWWCEMKNRATTSFGYCSSMAFLHVWPQCTNVIQIRCQADLNSFPLGELEETTGTPPYYVNEDYPAGPGISEPLPEWSNWCGLELSTLENDVYVWRYTPMVVHARYEWMTVYRCELFSVGAAEFTAATWWSGQHDGWRHWLSSAARVWSSSCWSTTWWSQVSRDKD